MQQHSLINGMSMKKSRYLLHAPAGIAAGSNLELSATAMPSASLQLDQPLLHMTAPAVAADAAPVIVGVTADRMLKRYVLPKELAGWSAVKGKHLNPQNMAHGPQKVHGS